MPHLARPRPPRARSRCRRRLRLARRRLRRLRRGLERRLILLSGWTWVAAGSLVGFEMLDVLFGTAVLVPELLPVLVIGLALAWWSRERLRRIRSRLKARLRLARMRRGAGAR